MKLFRKTISDSGRVRIYFLGLRIAKYKRRSHRKVNLFGKNNVIKFKNDIIKPETNISVYGNNNKVIVDTESWFKANINIGLPDCPCDNCVIKIGCNSSSNGVSIILLENNTAVTIGDNCMLSNNIQIWASDSHCVFDNTTHELTNVGKFVHIGNHVWICTGCYIGKNTFIADNCIVGMGSVATGRFNDTNCVVAGNPAKIVKRNIDWNQMRPQMYIDNHTHK